MNDNLSAYSSCEYDEQIIKNAPFYENFHDTAIELVKIINPNPLKWLDTGCGTGTFAKKLISTFTETEVFLADPSKNMFEIAKQISENISEIPTSQLDFPEKTFDVITAILSHHYMKPKERKLSTQNCLRMLKTDGVFITFENICPLTPYGIEIAMKRWWHYKSENGVSPEKENEHYARFNNEYLPITILEHLELLKNCGFKTYEIFWLSYMQAGFFAIK